MKEKSEQSEKKPLCSLTAQEEEAKDREQRDCQTVTSLCQELGIESVGIQKSYRVGKTQPEKHRPLKVTLNQKHTR